MARILIADDRESMRMAVKTVIRMHPGWEICGEADDGREAIAKALELNPDLVLLDFRNADHKLHKSGQRDFQPHAQNSGGDVYAP